MHTHTRARMQDDSKDYKQKMEDTRGKMSVFDCREHGGVSDILPTFCNVIACFCTTALGKSLRQTIEKMAHDLKSERQAHQNAVSHFETEEKNLKKQVEDLRQQLTKAQPGRGGASG